MNTVLPTSHAPGLVVLSLLLATLAAYTTTDLAHRIRTHAQRRMLWIALGGGAMGVGSWSTQLIGMQALGLHLPLGTALEWTLLWLLTAIAAWTAALYAASRAVAPARALLPAAVLIGGGLSLAQYFGTRVVGADAAVVRNALAATVAGVACSVLGVATLWILLRRRDEQQPQSLQLPWRVGAVLTMSLAVLVSHYGGITAAIVSDSDTAPASAMADAWTAGPVALATVLFLLLTMGLAAYDLRVQARIAEQRRQHESDMRARRLALYDGDTGLRNRASFQQEIVKLMHRCTRERRVFHLFFGTIGFPDLPAEHFDEAMRLLAERLKQAVHADEFLARHGRTEFTLLHVRRFAGDLPEKRREQLLAVCAQTLQVGELTIQPRLHVGIGIYPDHGSSSRELLTAAARDPHFAGRPGSENRARETEAA